MKYKIKKNENVIELSIYKRTFRENNKLIHEYYSTNNKNTVKLEYSNLKV